MTVLIDPPPSRSGLRSGASARAEAVVVGLVNNMPDSALEGTETQFLALLRAASGARSVHLRFAALPEVARGPDASARIAGSYWTIDELTAAPLDALIVTGTEPRAASLRHEPYWSRLVELLEYAQSATVSSIWSCLAAHAAVLALDGVERRRLPEKRCGVYGHSVLSGHVLTEGLATPHPVPHSRWNDLPVRALKAAGYTVLTESEETGADAFVKDGRTMLVFLQGHPEYEERTLLKEYQRDVQRFLSGQQPNYPTLPSGYFDPAATALLNDFKRQATEHPQPGSAAAFPFTAVAATLSSGWRTPAARLYSNWLAYVAAQKASAEIQGRYAL
jgi:homoserine O-succinyltransferase